MITIDLVCDNCGEVNPPGSEFCSNCNSYLAWDRSSADRPGRTTAPLPANPSVSAAADPQPRNPQPSEVPAAADYSPAGYPAEGRSQVGYAADPSAEQAGGYQRGPNGTYGGPATESQDITCDWCARVNPPTRRFCTHCGYSFIPSEVWDASADPASWALSAAAMDREARRAYRRSLPPLYRWRRVLITVAVVILVIALAVIVRDPVGAVKDGWYGLTNAYVTVAPVRAVVVPADASVPGSDPAALVDGSVNEWTMNWQPTQPSSCGPAAGTGVVVLSFAPTRIRQIQIVPGLDQSNPQRELQPQPKTLGISFDNEPCIPVTLSASPQQPALALDSGRPVTEVRIGIGSAYPAGADAPPRISLTEVILKSYPS